MAVMETRPCPGSPNSYVRRNGKQTRKAVSIMECDHCDEEDKTRKEDALFTEDEVRDEDMVRDLSQVG